MDRFEAWCQPLRRACQLEAERGFTDFQGRHDTYSGFVVRCLSVPDAVIRPGERQRLAGLVEGFRGYPGHGQPRRQQLVAQLRQLLHQLRADHRPALPVAPACAWRMLVLLLRARPATAAAWLQTLPWGR